MKNIVLLLLLLSSMCSAQTTIPGDYPQASEQFLGESDLQDMNGYQLLIMRNEIFARYGHIFKNADLREHFTAQDWYKPRFADVTSKLTDIEKSNVKLILAQEEKTRPIPLKKLPRLSLPIDLEQDLKYGAYEVIGISPHSLDDRDPIAYIGLLKDTTSYYGVLWITKVTLILPQGPTTLPVYYVTTYSKKLKVIASDQVTRPLGAYFEGPTDCTNSNFVHSSVINLDLSFSSLVSFQAECPSEKTQTMDSGVSGRIKSDGTIEVYRRN